MAQDGRGAPVQWLRLPLLRASQKPELRARSLLLTPPVLHPRFASAPARTPTNDDDEQAGPFGGPPTFFSASCFFSCSSC